MSDLLDDLEQSQLAAKARTSDRVGDMPTAPPLCDHAFQLESPREPSLQETRSSNDPTYPDSTTSGDINFENAANGLWQEYMSSLVTDIPPQYPAALTSGLHIGMPESRSPFQQDVTQSTQASLSPLQQIGFVPLYTVAGSGLGVVVVPPVCVNIHNSRDTSTEYLFFMPRAMEGSAAVFPEQLASVAPDAGWTMPHSPYEDTNSCNTNQYASSTTGGSGSDDFSFPHGVVPGQAPFLCSCGGLPRTGPMTGPSSHPQTYDGFIRPASPGDASQQNQTLPIAGTTSPWATHHPWPTREVTNYISPYADSNVIGSSTSSSGTMMADYTKASGPSWQH